MIKKTTIDACRESFEGYMSMNHGPRTQAVTLNFTVDMVEYYEKLYRNTNLEYTPHHLTLFFNNVNEKRFLMCVSVL